VDETFIGGPTPGAEGRDAEGKALVVIAAEEDSKGIGRIGLHQVPDASTPSLHGFIQQAINPGSTVHTNGWAPYQGLEKLGYVHDVTPLKGKGPQAAVDLFPRVHRVAALVKRWLLGAHQGAASPNHLDYYLDEFTFRFNRRRSASRGKLFFRLLQQAVHVGPVIYSEIIQGEQPRHKG
jgi:transposase-like protein